MQMLDEATASQARAAVEAKRAAKLKAQGGFKVCSKCHKKRRRTSFHRQSVGPYGTEYHRAVCKACDTKTKAAWREANPERAELVRKRSYEKLRKVQHLRHRFGLTIEQFDALQATSDGRCQICKRSEPRKNRRLSLDHDHKTGKLRGFTCSRCNMLLGLAQDDPALLESAAAYLRTANLGMTITAGHSVPALPQEERKSDAAAF